MELANTGGRPVKVLTETDVTKLEALACVLTCIPSALVGHNPLIAYETVLAHR